MIDEKLLQVLKHLLIVILIACFLLYIFLKKLNHYTYNDTTIYKKLRNDDSNEKNAKIPNEYDSLLVYQEKPLNCEDSFNNKTIKFSLDYCRANPNMNLKNKKLMNIGWRIKKFNFSINYNINNNGEKKAYDSILTIIPIKNSILDLNDQSIKENFLKLLRSLNHKNIMPYLHLDILITQNILIKILNYVENGSLRDRIYKTNALNDYSIKYKGNGNPMHTSDIKSYGKQILEALNFLHKNKWYHMNLHSGNVFLDNNQIKISELEMFSIDNEIKYKNYFNFAINKYNSDDCRKDSSIFEKIDIISFGRILYEMVFGKELKSQFPDETEYQNLNPNLINVFNSIFDKKNIFNNTSITPRELLKFDFFKIEDSDENFNQNETVDFNISYFRDQIFNHNKFII